MSGRLRPRGGLPAEICVTYAWEIANPQLHMDVHVAIMSG